MSDKKIKVQLKPEYVKLIQANPRLQGEIAQVTNKHINTIWRWCDQNTEQLTMFSVIECIREFSGLGKHVMLIEEVEVTEAKAA